MFEQIVEGQPKQYPESAVMDQDVLCYYAYSDLYDLGSEVAGVDSDGNPVDACERRRLLDGICHNAGPCVTPATTTKSAEPMAATQALVPAGICSTGGKPESFFSPFGMATMKST